MALLTQNGTVVDRIDPVAELVADEPLQRIAQFGPIWIDRYEHQAKIEGRLLSLTAMEYRLLDVLLRNAPHAVASDVLRQRIWGFDFGGGTNRLEVLVNQLRRKIGAHFIATEWKFGYRLVNPLTERQAEA